MKRWIVGAAAVFVFVGGVAGSSFGQDAAVQRADRFIEAATSYLRAQQHESGGWAVREEGPNFPAISGLVITGMLLDPRIDARDPDVSEGLAYIMRFRQEDGGIYDRVLASYNTAICLSALAHARAELPEAEAAVEPAVSFLRELQWREAPTPAAAVSSEVAAVDRAHPFYGGVGYGNSGRPDNSNLSLWLQGLQDAGVPGEDLAVQRALVFLQRTQMDGRVNDMAYAAGSMQGGFIYATSPSGETEQLGIGESKAGEITETLSDGTTASRLRAYGSMTYAGLKSYAYAGLTREDPRVQAALGWIAANYTLEENPGVGTDGFYYYLMVFARALEANGERTIEITASSGESNGDGSGERTVADWPVDLIDRLLSLQAPDGSLRPLDDRWLESDPVLITAYGLIAAQHARAALTREPEVGR
jgi:squalene-hopene/tetraprenyl-beta-curcumene cyclase